jgi:hypothetical protein
VGDYKITATSTTPGLQKVCVMDFFNILNHLLNFMAPAVAVGFLTALTARFFMEKVAVSHTVPAQAAINSIAGVVALTAGLVFFGRDGKMASYAAMVLAIATAQAWSARK